MSVAVFSANAELAEMLLLEAKRCGLRPAPPAQARVWLLDLDEPQTLPKGQNAPVQIGFSAFPDRVEKGVRSQLFALLLLPFSAAELDELLSARAPAQNSALLREGNELWLCGKRLHFSKTEQALFSLLYKNRHRVVTNAELCASIGESAENSNATAVYLYRLRRKLEADGITRIRTVRGVGYQWMGE